MQRKLFNAATLLALVLLVAVAWFVRPRGDRVDTYFHRTADGRYLFVTVYPGKVPFQRSTSDPTPSGMVSDSQPSAPLSWGHTTGRAAGWPTVGSTWNRLGFWHRPNTMTFVEPNNELVASAGWTVPKWFLLLAAACLPAVRFAAWLRRGHKQKRGVCHVCGYDLRATPDRCPECGAVPASSRREGLAGELHC